MDSDEVDHHNSRRSPSYRDSGELPRALSNRTLVDIIREEGSDGKTPIFKDKLRGPGSLSGGRGSNWTSTVPIPASDIPLNSSKRMRNPISDADPVNQPDISAVSDARSSSLLRTPSRPMERTSGRFEFDGPMKRLQREEEEEEEAAEEEECQEDASKEAEEEPRPVRMSLMSLLAEMDEEGKAYGIDEDEEEEEEEEEEDGALEYNNCCICMVRHKGTAFEPCGHSFCRLCSREMWVQGGNCPLCNNYILEILDIF